MNKVLPAAAITIALALTACGKKESDSATTTNSAAPAASSAPYTGKDWTETLAKTPEGGFRMGNPDAPVKLVEYASITCPHCGEFAETATTPLRDQYVRSGQVSWEYRPFMLFPTDPGIFMALRCNGPQPFFSMIDQLYATQRDWVGRLQVLTEQQQQAIQNMSPSARSAALVQAAGLDQFFRQRGMPQARLDACLADPRGLQRLTEITQYGTSHDNVNGTPTFFVNGERQDGVGVWNQLEPRLRAAMGS